MSQRILLWIFLIALNSAMWLYLLRERSEAKQRTPVPDRASVLSREQLPAAPVVVLRTNAFDWVQLESEDYKTYITRLRNVGCPEETIRDIVIADLEKMMSPRIGQIEGKDEPAQFWKPERKDLVSALETLQKLGRKEEVDFEKREIIQELLGIDLAAERSRTTGERDHFDERLSFLPPDKSSRVRMIMERANREEVYLREKSWLENDQLTPGEKGQLREIQLRKDREIAALLTPDEREQFDRWFSISANRVRDGFLLLEPNEQDFLALYEIQKAFDDEWQQVDPAEIPAPDKLRYQQEDQRRQEQIRHYLGEERFQQYRQSQDPEFQRLQRTAVQFGLGTKAASEVYAFKEILDEERAKIEAAPLTPDQKRQICEALSQETESAIVEVIGPKAYAYYLRMGAGQWIWK